MYKDISCLKSTEFFLTHQKKLASCAQIQNCINFVPGASGLLDARIVRGVNLKKNY